jgi:hypothetical protein
MKTPKTPKTHPAILLLALIGSLTGCAGNRAAHHPGGAGNTPAPPLTALDLLRQHDRQTTWEPVSEVRADLDHDGVVDYALRGLRKDRVVVGIVKGPLAAASRTWILTFPWGKEGQDSLCSSRVKIEAEDLDDSATAGAAKPARSAQKPVKGGKGKGISLYDDRCDAFHIYWSAEERKFAWWRL